MPDRSELIRLARRAGFRPRVVGRRRVRLERLPGEAMVAAWPIEARLLVGMRRGRVEAGTLERERRAEGRRVVLRALGLLPVLVVEG